MYTLAVLNQKGGVGKTAVTINLAGALAELGYRVLLVDLDPQGHLTEACDVPEATEPNTLASLMLDSDVYPDRVYDLVKRWREKVDIIPTNLDSFVLERQLYALGRAIEVRLRSRIVEVIEAMDVYDVCLIDCPPSLGALTDNALVAAGQVLVPVQSEDSALRALRLLLTQVDTARREMGIPIDLLGLVVNLFDKRKGRIVTSTLEALETMPVPILALIEDRAAIREAWRASLPVIEYAPDSTSAQAFRALAKQLLADDGEASA
ncbi:MAG: ParA family protein [Arthrobacter sp.]|uniref:ParA family protein n=1 Tax=Arthrobacter sp. TaxID=1667 RepID=UPI00349BA295